MALFLRITSSRSNEVYIYMHLNTNYEPIYLGEPISMQQNQPSYMPLIVRFIQISLGFGFSIFFMLIFINNCVDYNTNFNFVKNVLEMKHTFHNSPLNLRAISSNNLHHFIYLMIMVYELICGLLMAYGSYRLIECWSQPSQVFHQAKAMLLMGFGLSILLWFYGFIIIGSEWFLMWQSKQWNGFHKAFELLCLSLLSIGIVLHNEREQKDLDHEKKIADQRLRL